MKYLLNQLTQMRYVFAYSVPLILYTDAAISTILFNILMEMCVLIRLKITMKSLKSLWILAL